MKAWIWMGFLVPAAFFAGRSMVQSPLPSPSDCALDSVPKTKFQQLLDVDYADYQRLKTLEEKYKKADEILGKVILIFLSDLKLHLASGHPKELPDAHQTPLAKSESSPRSNPERILPSQSHRPPLLPVAQVRQEEQIDQLLQTKKREHFQSDWTRAQPLQSFPVTLNGCFAGTLTEEKDHQVIDLKMFHRLTGGEGQSLIVLTYPDGGRSRSRGKGKPNGYRTSTQDPDALYIETADALIYQLYYLPALNRWVGNAYKKLEDESRVYWGRVSLTAGSGCEE